MCASHTKRFNSGRRSPQPYRISFFVGVVLWLNSFTGAADTTTLPMTYVTAVSGEVMDDPTFLVSIRRAPPNVLHLGHVLPLNSVFGPTADFSGFKPKLVPVEEILKRRDRIKLFMDQLHAAGVQRVVCYINPAIVGGDHLTREGFWAFYDHWDDYASLGIGAKPLRDPIRWMQRERQSFGAWAPEPNMKGVAVRTVSSRCTPFATWYLFRERSCQSTPHPR